MLRVAASIVVSLVTAAAMPASPRRPAQNPPLRRPDVIFVESQTAVVDAMLAMAKVTARDVVYDLGCGNGKIVIAAARQYGARGVGIDIDPERISEANAAAKAAGVTSQVTFILGDILSPDTKIGEATVVTLFLLPSLNQKLRPRLLAELKPGTRVVSNSFDMGPDWPAEQTREVGDYTVYLWTIPKRSHPMWYAPRP